MLHSTSRYIGAAILVVLAFSLAGCRQEVRFTKVPAPVPDQTKSKPKLTAVYAGVPVDLSVLETAVKSSVPRNMKKIVAFLEDAACYTRDDEEHCRDARVYTYLRRDGEITLETRGARLLIKVPLRYKISAKGQGAARRQREKLSGKVSATLALNVRLNRKLEPEVSLADSVEWSTPEIPVLNGQFDLRDYAGGKIKGFLRKTPDLLEEALDAAPIANMVARVWKTLHGPIKLDEKGDTWLVNSPVSITDGGFTQDRGRLLYRVAIGTRMGIVTGDRPDRKPARRMPRAKQLEEDTVLRSVLRMPIAVGFTDVQTALKKAWQKPIDIPADADTEAMKLVVTDSELYPSQHLLALGLNIDVETTSRTFDLTGMAYLTALPVVDPKSRKLVLRNIKLAERYTIPGVGAGTGRRFRLSLTPFRDGFASLVKVDVADRLDALLARANGMFEQISVDGMQLQGRFDGLSVDQVRISRKGFALETDLSGELLFTTPDLQAELQLSSGETTQGLGTTAE